VYKYKSSSSSLRALKVRSIGRSSVTKYDEVGDEVVQSQKTEDKDRDEVLLRALRTKSCTKLLRRPRRSFAFVPYLKVKTKFILRHNNELLERRSPLFVQDEVLTSSHLHWISTLDRRSSLRQNFVASSLDNWTLGNLRTTRTYEPHG